MSAKLIFFAHDANDARVRKRVQAFLDLGLSVQGFTFRRGSFGNTKVPFWENVDLGETFDRRYGQRITSLCKALFAIWKNRSLLCDATSFYAINIDNILLAIFARLLCSKPIQLVYENVDIQPIFLNKGWKGKVFRGVERWALRRINLLITSSPTFVTAYFQQQLGYQGNVFLLENKVYPSGNLGKKHESRSLSSPIRIGYFGGFRCVRSWEMIKSLANRFPQTLHFYLRGYPTLLDKDLFFKDLDSFSNIEYGGTFQFPDDLSDMYTHVDLVWCFDYYAPESNSKWLLPTRLYDGGLFQVPMLGDANTATGQFINEKGIGWTFVEDVTENLASFLSNLTDAQYQEVRANYHDLDRDLFAGESDYAQLVAMLKTPS